MLHLSSGVSNRQAESLDLSLLLEAVEEMEVEQPRVPTHLLPIPTTCEHCQDNVLRPTNLSCDLVAVSPLCYQEGQEPLYHSSVGDKLVRRQNPYLEGETIQQEMMCVLYMRPEELKEVMQTLSLTQTERKEILQLHKDSKNHKLFFDRLVFAKRLYENEQSLTRSQANLLMLVQYAKVVRVTKDLTSSHGQPLLNLIASLIASPSRKQAALESPPRRSKLKFRNEADITNRSAAPLSPFCFMMGMPVRPLEFQREVNRLNEETRDLQGKREPRLKLGDPSPSSPSPTCQGPSSTPERTAQPLSPTPVLASPVTPYLRDFRAREAIPETLTPFMWKWNAQRKRELLGESPVTVSKQDSSDFAIPNTESESDPEEELREALAFMMDYQIRIAGAMWSPGPMDDLYVKHKRTIKDHLPSGDSLREMMLNPMYALHYMRELGRLPHYLAQGSGTERINRLTNDVHKSLRAASQRAWDKRQEGLSHMDEETIVVENGVAKVRMEDW